MDNGNLMQETSDKFDVVIKQLMQAKREMGSSVKKDATNPFHKSKYATLGAHLELCEATLDRHGLIMLQTINGSPEKAILIATLCHAESGQWIKSYLPLPNPKGDSQGLGASITYMRRYSINSMLGLNAEDDDGESACVRPKKETKPAVAPEEKATDLPLMSKEQISMINSSLNQMSENNRKEFLRIIKEKFNCASVEESPASLFNKFMVSIEARIKTEKDEKKVA